MRFVPPFARLASGSVALLFMTGCGNEISSPVVAPERAVVDQAPPSASPDVGDRSDTEVALPMDVPFSHAFLATSDVACASSGATKLQARFFGDSYQFSSCRFSVQRGAAVRGDVTVTAEGWTVAATPRGDSDLDVAFGRPSGTFDWNDDPVVVRFDFHDAKGRPAHAFRTLRPASGPEVLTLGAPRLARTRLAPLPVLTSIAWGEHEGRVDAAGVPVLRAHEPLAFEVPFSLVSNVEGDALAGTYLAQPDPPFPGDACLFADFHSTPAPSVFALDRRDWRTDASGQFFVFAAGDAVAHAACAGSVSPSERQTGLVTFDPHMGGYTATSPFAVRLVPRALDEDAKLRMHAVGNVLEGFEAINIAPYSLHSLRIDLTLDCATDSSMSVAATLGVPPERAATTARPFYRAFPVGGSATWDVAEVRDVLRRAVGQAQAKCERHAWNVSTARVVEGDGASWTRVIPLGPLEVFE